MVTDVVALSVAYAALRVAQRPPTERHTYGFGRTEVLVAQANAVILFVGGVAVVVEAVHRIHSPEAVDAAGVIIVGVLGLAVNFGSAALLGRHAHGNINMRAAWWHLMADAFGSVAVIVAGVGSAVFGVDWLDPAAAILIAVLVFFAAARLMRDATNVLLEAAPAGIQTQDVLRSLEGEQGVEAVHHLHLWTTGSEHAALSAHVVLGDTLTLHDAQNRVLDLKQMLSRRFGIEHATLEVECHACEDDETHELSPSHPHEHGH